MLAVAVAIREYNIDIGPVWLGYFGSSVAWGLESVVWRLERIKRD
jgi:hypothetical protein